MNPEYIEVYVSNVLDLIQLIIEDIEVNFISSSTDNAVKARARLTISALSILSGYLRSISGGNRGMDEAHKKAQATRQRLAEERAALFREQAESTRAARLALRHVMEREDATPAEILEAARLLVEIGKQ